MAVDNIARALALNAGGGGTTPEPYYFELEDAVDSYFYKYDISADIYNDLITLNPKELNVKIAFGEDTGSPARVYNFKATQTINYEVSEKPNAHYTYYQGFKANNGDGNHAPQFCSILAMVDTDFENKFIVYVPQPFNAIGEYELTFTGPAYNGGTLVDENAIVSVGINDVMLRDAYEGVSQVLGVEITSLSQLIQIVNQVLLVQPELMITLLGGFVRGSFYNNTKCIYECDSVDGDICADITIIIGDLIACCGGVVQVLSVSESSAVNSIVLAAGKNYTFNIKPIF